jgi:hypothetical protein
VRPKKKEENKKNKKKIIKKEKIKVHDIETIAPHISHHTINSSTNS